jgi:hypothetical protein
VSYSRPPAARASWAIISRRTIMKRVWPQLSLWIAAGIAAAGLPVAAQNALPDPADPAATKAVRPQPRPMTPVQQAQATATPGELRPERPVTPQIQAPIGRVPPATTEPTPVPTETLDQRLARCQAELGEKARTECRQRAELARPPLPPR